MSLATWVRFLMGVDSFCRALAILRGAESVHRHASFYIAVLSINSFFLGFVSVYLAQTQL